MKAIKLIILSLGLLLTATSMQAQKGLSIDSVFNDYGKEEGSILIELARDVLGNRTRISKYKSLIRENDPDAYNVAIEAIEKDLEDGLKLMESKKDGKIESGYYCLKKAPESNTYEYILFKYKSKKLTLVYVRGNFPPLELEKELSKLKDLFIKVNNKRIKLSVL